MKRYSPPAKRQGLRLGKRTRRARIRLRHAIAERRFIYWLGHKPGQQLSGDFYKPFRYEARYWHEWHALGCPK